MKYLIFAVVLSFVVVACDKNESNDPSKTDLLISGAWKFNDAGLDIDNNGAIDIAFGAGTLPSCVVDNQGTFNANGTGVNDEGATKCNITDPQTTTFNWSFQSNETMLTISGASVFGITGQFKVLELTSAKLSLSKDTSVAAFPGSIGLIVNLKH
jgi:hypothetical protein